MRKREESENMTGKDLENRIESNMEGDLKMENSEKRIQLEFDSRVFELLAKDLYRDKLAFLRELTQNSLDAGATRIEWEYDFVNHIIRERDNGKGMSYEFVEKDWKKVGKAFKKGSEIGMYGIGRLSVWLVAEKVKIWTQDVEIDWESISEYKIRRTNNYVQGFVCEIKLKPEVWSDISDARITQYLYEHINVPVEILYNGEPIPKISSIYTFFVEVPSEKAKVWLKKPEDRWDAIKIFEKGLLVRTEYSSSVECLIDFEKPIKTLSRESTTINTFEIYEVLRKAVLELCRRYLRTPELKERYFDKIKEIAKTIKYLANKFNSEELASYYPVQNKLLKEFKDFYYSFESPLVERAIKEGYNVLVIEDKEEETCCKLVGLKPLTDLKEKLKRSYFIKDTEQEKGIRILKSCANIMEALTEIVEKAQSKLEKKLNGRTVRTDKLLELKETAKKTLESLDFVKIENSSGKVHYTLGKLAFGETEDSDVVAFQYGEYTVLNLNNELIDIILQTERLDLLEEALTHEFVHRLGIFFHDETFTSVYNWLRCELLKWKALNTARFETKTQITKISGKYEQGLIKIPKEALEKLKLTKGKEIAVIIEPLETEENQGIIQ